MIASHVEQTILRHSGRAALQFSGGKDSLAVLTLLEPMLDHITVYWLNTGDPFPEVVEMMAHIRKAVPHFAEIKGRQPEVHQALGWPSDVVPASHTPFGVHGVCHEGNQPIIDRYTCCFNSLMKPMQERMHEDGITLVIRGQKTADARKPTVRSGDVIDGVEFLFPVEDWTDEQVFDYLKRQGVPLPLQYSTGGPASMDCLHCTAWLEHKQLPYLKAMHPMAYQVVRNRLSIINEANQAVMRSLRETLEEHQ